MSHLEGIKKAGMLGVVVHTCNPSTGDGAGSGKVPGKISNLRLAWSVSKQRKKTDSFPRFRMPPVYLGDQDQHF